MKLIIAIVHHDDAGKVLDGLLQAGHRATRLQSSGGFLRRSNATLFVAADEDAVDAVIGLIRANTKPRTHKPEAAAGAAPSPDVDLRAAVVFVLPIERFDRV